ncbi:MAG: hypothetical protein ACLUD2_21620 [Clostridium sp.]
MDADHGPAFRRCRVLPVRMAVLTLQYGDGFTNLFAPTSVNLMACLAMAKVDLKQWYKFHTVLRYAVCGSCDRIDLCRYSGSASKGVKSGWTQGNLSEA